MAAVIHVPLILWILALVPCTEALINRHYVNWSQPCIRNYECQQPELVSCIPVVPTLGFGDCNKTDYEKNPNCRCYMRSSKGQACNDLADCKGDLRCLEGRCAVSGAENRKCLLYFDDRDCEKGFTCVNQRCTPKARVNESCEAFWNCKEGKTCIKDVCKEKSRPGGECETSIDCVNSICKKKPGANLGVCDADVAAIMGSVVAFSVVIVTTGTLQYCAWKPRRLA